MSWRTRNTKSRQSWGSDWIGSSGEEPGHDSEHGMNYRRGQQPARNGEEALWRLAKRFGSAFRWLKMDLLLVGELNKYGDLVNSLGAAVRDLGNTLLPGFGDKPLSASLVSQSDIMDFIGVLAMLPDSLSQSIGQTDGLQSKDVGTQHSGCMKGVAQQTDGLYMSRFPHHLAGEWVPLESASCRRGAIIKCTKAVTTDTASSFNFRIGEGQLCKILNIDTDGDMRLGVITEANIAGLYIPSESRWLLKQSFDAFEIWMPTLSEEAASIRLSRRRSDENDEENA